MRPPSDNWLKEIEVFRNRAIDGSYSIPTYPWLAPPLHPRIRSLIENWGVESHIGTDEPLLGRMDEPIEKLVLVKSGVTARCFGSFHAVRRPAVAFSTPGRLACGNLNFFSKRPCIGSYFALVPSVVIGIPQSLLMSVCQKDPEMLMLVASEFELINLTDRMGFGAHASLSVEDRLLAYFLTWTVAFGREEIIDGISWARFPTPLRGTALQYVVNCSSTALERVIGNLKASGKYVIENDTARIQLSLLQHIHKWMRNIEEKNSCLHRDALSSIINNAIP